MGSSKIDPEEVMDAIATLRTFALTGRGSELSLAWAIDTLDNADVFVGIDGEGV